MKKNKKLTALLVVASALVLAACGKTEQKEQIANEDIKSISLLRPSWNDLRPASKDLWMWQEYEKMSGIKVNWEEMTDIGEKKNIILTRETLPDAFYQVDWSNGELLKYGQQEMFIPLEDLIKKHAPNLQKFLDENEDVRKGLTSADGHIYATPYLDPYPEGNRTIRLWINKTWLDKLDMDVPKTTADLEKALVAFVNEDPNGNGQKDEQGWYMPSGSIGWTFEQMLMGSFGIGNGGRKALGNFIYIDKDDQVQVTIAADEYKELLKYEHNLYEKGAINKQAFSGVEYDKWTADAAKDTVGAWNWAAPDYIGESVKDNYVAINVLAGPNGDQASLTDSPVAGASSLIITKEAANPGKILEWVDYFYSEEGSEFGYLGKEGVTYNIEDGKKVYIDEILNYKDGIGLGAFQYVDNVYGGYFPYVELPAEVRDAAGRKETLVYDDLTEETLPSVMLPDLPATIEEANRSSSIVADIGNYVGQMRVDFVTGKKDIDKEWKTYIETLKKMGVDEYLKIKQTQYKRYKDS